MTEYKLLDHSLEREWIPDCVLQLNVPWTTLNYDLPNHPFLYSEVFDHFIEIWLHQGILPTNSDVKLDWVSRIERCFTNLQFIYSDMVSTVIHENGTNRFEHQSRRKHYKRHEQSFFIFNNPHGHHLQSVWKEQYCYYGAYLSLDCSRLVSSRCTSDWRTAKCHLDKKVCAKQFVWRKPITLWRSSWILFFVNAQWNS